MTCNSNKATFFGTLDTKTLGGAGFASQRTASDTATWDLSAFDGIELQVDAKHSDDKQYTLIFKDHLPDSDRRDAREQSSLSWEADFAVRCTSRSAADHDDLVSVFLPWEDFKPTYRGKEQKSKHGPALGSIKRVSIMMRRYAIRLSRQQTLVLTIGQPQLLWQAARSFPTDHSIHSRYRIRFESLSRSVRYSFQATHDPG